MIANYWKLTLQKDFNDPTMVVISAETPNQPGVNQSYLIKGDVTYLQLQGRLVKIKLIQ